MHSHALCQTPLVLFGSKSKDRQSRLGFEEDLLVLAAFLFYWSVGGAWAVEHLKLEPAVASL